MRELREGNCKRGCFRGLCRRQTDGPRAAIKDAARRPGLHAAQRKTSRRHAHDAAQHKQQHNRFGRIRRGVRRYPARVQLLLVVDAKIDERRFRDAVEAAIGGIALGPVRINGGSGCALSVVEDQDEALFSQRPPSPLLFTREPCAAPLAWRLSVGATKSAVGLSFDHACAMSAAPSYY